jgi:hypothetical protein
LISVKNPTNALLIPDAPVTEFNVPSAALIVATDLIGWTDIVPDALEAFDNATGTFTAPENGDYVVTLVANYETSVPLAVDPGLINIPTLEIYDVSTSEKILASQLSAISHSVQIPPQSSGDLLISVPLAYLVNRSIVTISAVIPLVLGQLIRVRASANGLTIPPTVGVLQVIPALPPRIIFNPANVDTTLTIYKIRNSPIVTIKCNN